MYAILSIVHARIVYTPLKPEPKVDCSLRHIRSSIFNVNDRFCHDWRGSTIVKNTNENIFWRRG